MRYYRIWVPNCYCYIFCLFLIPLGILGCGADESLEEGVPVANFVSVDPPGGCHSGTITVTFDNPPHDVTVSAGTVEVTDNIATIRGPFTPGALALTITWHSGTQALNYTVTGFDCK